MTLKNFKKEQPHYITLAHKIKKEIRGLDINEINKDYYKKIMKEILADKYPYKLIGRLYLFKTPKTNFLANKLANDMSRVELAKDAALLN